MRQFTMGPREIDLDRAEVRGAQGAVPLTPNEVKVLAVLARRAGHVVERDVLLCEALGYRQAVNTRAIDQAVWRLRRKIEPEPHAPRWLLSEANVGYRLELHPPPPRTVSGRSEEVNRLSALLDGVDPVVVVGLPGSGRRTVVRATATLRGWRVAGEGDDLCVSGDGRERTVRIVSSFPDDPRVQVVRIGPLDPEAARALLVREVLALRGTSHLSEDEDAEAAPMAARAGHHPATLRRMAEGSVLRRLGQVPLEVIPEVAAHVASLPDDVGEVLIRCAPYPDPFLPDEVGIDAESLTRAWRVCVLDSVEEADGQRRLVVPACVRAVVPPEPGHSASHAFAASVVAGVVPAAIAFLRSHDDGARARILRDRPRVDAAWALGGPDERRALLPFLVARWATTDALPDPVPTDEAALTPDQAVCVDLLRAFADERAERGGGSTSIARALSRTGVSPTFAGYVLRSAFSDVMAHGSTTDAEACVDAMQRLAEAHPDPALLAAFRAARGTLRMRRGEWRAAHDDFVGALTLYGPRAGTRFRIASELAIEALDDGRVDEALAWLDRADPAASAPSQEAVRRLMRSSVLQAAGRLADADRELSLVELLGSRPRALMLARALQSLLEGRIEQAVVLAESARIDGGTAGDVEVAVPLVLGWTRVAQGLGDHALHEVERCVPALLIHSEHGVQLDLLRAAALARSTRQDGVGRAVAALEGLAPAPGQWWPLTRRAVLALIHRDAAGAAAVEADMARTAIAHWSARIAVAATRATIRSS